MTHERQNKILVFLSNGKVKKFYFKKTESIIDDYNHKMIRTKIQTLHHEKIKTLAGINQT